jgi:lipopolysaccharide export system permease protein
MRPRTRFVLPTVARYVTMQFLRTFALTVLAFVAIYVIADFFDRFDTFLKQDVSALTIARSVLYKIPTVLVQVTPLAVLAGGLVGFGLLARHNEFVALRSCGVSLWQVTAPLAVVSILIAVATFVWGETVVPASAKRWNQVWNQEVKKKSAAGVFAGREVWYHGRAGFYNINRVAPRQQTLYGLTIYQVRQRDFRPTRVIEVASATWNGTDWTLANVHTRYIDADGIHDRPGAPHDFTLPERFDDFTVVTIESEEYSYAMLRRQIKSLMSKGIDVSESWVDLHLKLALPAASVVMMLLAVPLTARGTRATSLPAAAGLGFAIGFSYFIVVAFARTLGQSHALPPLVAAWAGNVVFSLLAGYCLLAAE